MSGADRFLQAIRDAPYDDELRLVFADWLDDHGDPRGQLMRLEVALARLPEDDPGRGQLRQQSLWLQDLHGTHWLGPLHNRILWSCPRGLLALDGRADDVFPLPEAAGVYPWVERVRLSEVGRPGCACLRELERMPNLTSLDLNHNHLGPELANAVLELPSLS